jgi:hypothetical protein
MLKIILKNFRELLEYSWSFEKKINGKLNMICIILGNILSTTEYLH